MLEINPQATRKSSSDWYRTVAGTTAERENKAIGVEEILVYPHQQTQAVVKSGAIARVWVKTVIGGFELSVFRGKKDPNTLRLVQPQREYQELENGVQVTKYADYYSLNEQVRAQVLRHVESMCVNTGTGEVQQAPAQTDASAILGGLSPEQLQALMAILGGGQAQAQAQPQAQAQTAPAGGFDAGKVDDIQF